MFEIKKTVLPSGIKIISENVHYLKSFSVGFWFDTGSINENKKNNGISHFIEHMLFKGTKNRSAKKIADDIESLGGYLNAFTSKEHTCYYGRGLISHLDKTFEVLADMVQFPLFNEKDIEKEAMVILDEYFDIEDTPEELIFDKFESEIYAGHSFELPIIGTEKNINSFSGSDLAAFMKKHYGNNNLLIVASGAIEHDRLVKLVEKYVVKDFGKVKNRNKEILDNPATKKIIKKEIQQSHLLLGSRTYGINDDRRVAVSLLSHVLGEGSSSRLFQVLREKNGIAYHLNSFYNLFYDSGSFGVYLSTNNESFKKAGRLLDNEFEKIKSKKVSERELNRAKEYLVGNIIMSLESTTERMNRVAHSEIYFGTHKTVEETIAEIRAVGRDEILAIANEVLAKEALSQVVISSDENIVL